MALLDPELQRPWWPAEIPPGAGSPPAHPTTTLTPPFWFRPVVLQATAREVGATPLPPGREWESHLGDRLPGGWEGRGGRGRAAVLPQSGALAWSVPRTYGWGSSPRRAEGNSRCLSHPSFSTPV